MLQQYIHNISKPNERSSETHPERYGLLRRPFALAAAAAAAAGLTAVPVTLRRHIEMAMILCGAAANATAATTAAVRYQRCRGAIQRRRGGIFVTAGRAIAAGAVAAAVVAAGAVAVDSAVPVV